MCNGMLIRLFAAQRSARSNLPLSFEDMHKSTEGRRLEASVGRDPPADLRCSSRARL